MDFNSIWMFIKVVEAGSFSKAAREIEVPKSTLSKKIAELEKSLQTTLLRRTTRNTQLTEVGSQFYSQCSKAYSEIRAAQAGTQALSSEPVGLLRVTAPADFGQGVMNDGFSSFIKKYPKVTLELVLTDQVLDFIKDNIDVAIRGGDLEDSNLKARKLGVSRFHLVASPEYLEKSPRIKEPNDLKKQSCLIFTGLPDPHAWIMKSGTKKVRLQIEGRYLANSINSIKYMACRGNGIALLPLFLCKNELRTEQLQLVLPDWTALESPTHFVYQNEFFIPPKITTFLDHMDGYIREIFELRS